MNEISMPSQTGRWVQGQDNERNGYRCTLVQQTMTNLATAIKGRLVDVYVIHLYKSCGDESLPSADPARVGSYRICGSTTTET